MSDHSSQSYQDRSGHVHQSDQFFADDDHAAAEVLDHTGQRQRRSLLCAASFDPPHLVD